MRQTFNALTGKFDIVGVTDGELPSVPEQWMVEPYFGLDEPGVFPNVLDEGKSRIWFDTGNSKVYLVNLFDGVYRRVELTA